MSVDSIVLHPAYFPSIDLMGVLYHRGDLVRWEAWDNYQKQTYRNRCRICTDQGVFYLNIPIRHLGELNGRQRYREVRIDESSGWRELHWKTIQAAYRGSPYFEYYEESLERIYFPAEGSTEDALLYEFNLSTIRFACQCLDLEMPGGTTDSYALDYGKGDGRYLINAKHRIDPVLPTYIQVFGDRHGFVTNASVLDLLCNLGPEGSTYLAGLSSYSDFF